MVLASETARIVPPGVVEAARHLTEGSTEAALAALQSAGAAGDDGVPLKFMTALLAWRLGNVAAALTLCRSSFEREPENGTIAEAVASLYAQVGNLRESLFYGKLAIALPPDATMSAWFPADFPMFDIAFLSIREKPLLARARIFLGGGDWRMALDQAQQHLAVAPEDDEGRHFYAEQLLRAGSAGAAVEVLGPYIAAKAPSAAITSTVARALAAVGEVEKALQWHDQACLMAAGDAAIAAARITDARALGDDGERQKLWTADWLRRFIPPAKARRWRPCGERLTIGYLVSHTARNDVAAVAAVASAHPRPGTTVVGYGRGAQSWEENAVFGSAFEKWRDITGFDFATLAKTLAVDGIDVVIDTAGFSAPINVRALACVDGAIRVAWLGVAEGLEQVVYDARIGPGPTGIDAWHAAHGGYPLLRDWTREVVHVPDERCRFGMDASLAEIDGRTIHLLGSVLARVPGSILLLRANDMAHHANIDRLIARFGRDRAARIDIVDAAPAEDFYRMVDIAVAPGATASPHLVGEAIACGVPVLAVDDGGGQSVCSAALRGLGLGELVFKDAAAFTAAAESLARSPQERRAMGQKVAAVADLHERIAAEIAATIEERTRAMLGKAAA